MSEVDYKAAGKLAYHWSRDALPEGELATLARAYLAQREELAALVKAGRLMREYQTDADCLSDQEDDGACGREARGWRETAEGRFDTLLNKERT